MADTTATPDGEPSDLSPEDLDSVAGGTFHTQVESGSPIGAGTTGIHLTTQVRISDQCLNPQPLPP